MVVVLFLRYNRHFHNSQHVIIEKSTRHDLSLEHITLTLNSEYCRLLNGSIEI